VQRQAAVGAPDELEGRLGAEVAHAAFARQRAKCAAQEAGFARTKVNMVLIPGFNDGEVEAMMDFCRRNGLRLQRIHHYSLHDLRTSQHALEAERPLSCAMCNRLRLTADGMLKPCLFSDREIAVDFNDIRASLERAVRAKPPNGVACENRGNWQIGG